MTFTRSGAAALAPSVLAVLVLLATACSAPARKAQPLIVYPPAPGLPRLQYSASFSGSRDVEPQTAFNRFVVGENQDVKLDKPYGVAMHDGRIYVCDTNATVVVFDLKAKRFGVLKGAIGPGRLVEPINISIEADGTKDVADPARGQVVVFDANDEYVKAFGEPGDWRPVDAAAFEDRLYVADIAGGLVKVFDKRTGAMIKAIGAGGDPSERLDRPTNLALDGDGNLYVTDFGRFQVVVFDREGRFQRSIGKAGDGPGHFARPKGIAVDREGRLFVVDASFNNVQVFNREGRILLYFGEGGQNPGNFLLPAKVSIDYDNVGLFKDYLGDFFRAEYLVLVTSQFGPNAVSVYAYGQEQGRFYPSDDDLLRQADEERRKKTEPAAPATPAPPPAPLPAPPPATPPAASGPADDREHR